MSICVVLFAGVFLGQEIKTPPKAHASTTAVENDMRPISGEEAFDVFTRARTMLNQTLKGSLGKSSIASSGNPVTREAVVGEMGSILTELQSKIKFVPSPVPFDPTVFKIQPKEKGLLVMLVKRGYVPRVSHLAVGPSDSLTPKQLGDALGFFLCRLAELTNQPSPKWTPILGAGSG